MLNQLDTTAREKISRLLDAGDQNPLKAHLYEDADVHLQGRQTSESSYKHYVVETQPSGQQEIYPLRDYTERDLAGIASRPTFRFRWKCKRLLEQAEQVLAASANDLEFEHRATLLWAEVVMLAEYLGSTAEIDEVISALHNAYAQHVKRITPKPVIEALVLVFRRGAEYTRLPMRAVDDALDVLERAGVDLNFPVAFDKDDGRSVS